MQLVTVDKLFFVNKVFPCVTGTLVSGGNKLHAPSESAGTRVIKN